MYLLPFVKRCYFQVPGRICLSSLCGELLPGFPKGREFDSFLSITLYQLDQLVFVFKLKVNKYSGRLREAFLPKSVPSPPDVHIQLQQKTCSQKILSGLKEICFFQAG